jgi:ADP-heptose:LPS heptosyltransferase
MHGSGRASNPFVLALGASCTIGYYENVPAGLTLETVYPDHLHEIYRNLYLVELMEQCLVGTDLSCPGVGTRGNIPATNRFSGVLPLRPTQDAINRSLPLRSLLQLEFPLCANDYAEADALLRPFQQEGKPMIGLHPGARPPARRWPATYFATVADMLARQFDALILLTGGSGEEQTVQAVRNAMHTPAVSLAGKTSLGGLAALISRFDLFISNDTGPSHIACAVDCPSVTLFGPADVRRWAPLNRQRHPIVRHPVACSPCGYWECPIDHRCLRWLTPDVVLMAATEMLQKENVQQCNV